MDNHNAKRHGPISIEVVWATKQWPNRVFAFLFSITEVNCFLAESYFTSRKTGSMMDFRKDLAHQLIENKYLVQEIRSDCRRSVRIQQGIGHGLLSLPPFKIFLMDGWSIPSHATLRINAVAAQEKCGPTASVLLEAICVVTASLNTLKRPTSTVKATSRFTVDCNFFCDCLVAK